MNNKNANLEKELKELVGPVISTFNEALLPMEDLIKRYRRLGFSESEIVDKLMELIKEQDPVTHAKIEQFNSTETDFFDIDTNDTDTPI